ncbi:hypothetical protein [Photobacterium halotolerans]|uniref:Uncharacterized protein n=1 Tax=Photobacterium halotolerans TaxID=265726 RepID=A0A0F5V8L7_9GAMM|nr:hypothetical protein [Photobacterium halotolerans]KKC97859.1 hypothetical protein KY46_21600 [Photobacterium halotolerans]
MTNLNISGTYLMGRLYGRDGEVTRGAKFYPLSYETMVLPNDNWVDELTYNDKNQLISRVKTDFPIAYSDQHGKLNLFIHDQGMTEFKLSGSPIISKSHAKESIKREVVFFPARMIPLYQSSYLSGWNSELHKLLSGGQGESNNVFSTDEKVLNLKQGKSQLLETPDNKRNEISEKSEYYKKYITWYDSLSNDENHDSEINIIEVPQYYTIVVNFSSDDYLGATVKIKDYPRYIRIMGTEDLALSKVNEVNFNDHDNQDKPIYCATFWIETDILHRLNDIEEYCSFEINLETVINVKSVRRFQEKNIIQYSLKERVFNLPIKTTIGRSVIVNGDPISVEEAILIHAPEYFQNIVSKLNDNPYKLPQNMPTEAGESQKYLWHYLQSYKGLFEAGALQLEKGTTAQLISKVVYATISYIAGGTQSEFSQSLLSAAGVAGSANSLIESISKLKVENSKIVTKAKEFQTLLGDRVVLDIIPMPQSIKPFISGVGKVGGFLLDKPLTAVNGIVNLRIVSITMKNQINQI